MYESKKNSGRKDTYKYQKSSHQKNFHNSTHFGYHKYNKFKQKYCHSNSMQDYDEETIFYKAFDESKTLKKNDLKEIDELTPTPTIKTSEKLNDNKENFSLNLNINEMKTQMKTNDINELNDINETNNEINENISSFSKNSSFNISDNLNIFENEKKDEIINEINKLSSMNNINFNNNKNINININYNVENVINDILIKRNESIFSSNEKEDIHIEVKKNGYKTPQSFKANSSPINLSSNDMKEAFYIPKKLSTIYDTHAIQQQTNFLDRKHNSLNNFNFIGMQRPKVSLSNKNLSNYNNLGISNNINLNFFKNNNNNNNFMNFNRRKSSININNNFNIQNSSNMPLTSFNIFDSNNIGNIGNINLSNFQQCLNNNNSHHNINKNPFHNMMPQLELNKCILKTQINNNNLFEKDKENTDILEINVKVSQSQILTFKIRRYDDMFKTVKIFCEINKLDIKLIRPFIIYIIRALNSIYGIYNLNLKNDEIEFLKDIKKNLFNEEDEKKEINENEVENKNEKDIINDENDENEFYMDIHSDSKDNKDDNSDSEDES